MCPIIGNFSLKRKIIHNISSFHCKLMAENSILQSIKQISYLQVLCNWIIYFLFYCSNHNEYEIFPLEILNILYSIVSDRHKCTRLFTRSLELLIHSWNLNPWNSYSPFLTLSSYFLLSWLFTILDMSYMWNHAVSVSVDGLFHLA
jgi:hypothetical protein